MKNPAPNLFLYSFLCCLLLLQLSTHLSSPVTELRASGSFTGGRTDTRIQFCLSKTDPYGGKTTGIIRTKTFLGDYDYDMEANNMTALGRWDPSRYVNIWVVEDIKSEYMQSFDCGV